MSSKQKISLDLFNRLASELNLALVAVDQVPASDGNRDTIVALSKVAGLLGIIVQEGGLLIKDVYALVQMQSAGGMGGDPIEELNQMLGNLGTPKRSAN